MTSIDQSNSYPGNRRFTRVFRRGLQKSAAVFNKLEIKLRPAVRMDGDRIIEWSFIAGNLTDGPGAALDFGPGHAWMGLVAVERGFQVTEVDLRTLPKLYEEPGIQTLVGDIKNADLTEGSFDVVINCSSIEHVGLAGRYGVEDSATDGDIEVMKHLKSLLAKDGRMLLTLPVGQDSVFLPLHRVYGEKRLSRLLDGWSVEKSEFWIKHRDNRWHRAERDEATSMKPRFDLYGLGCFVLTPA